VKRDERPAADPPGCISRPELGRGTGHAMPKRGSTGSPRGSARSTPSVSSLQRLEQTTSAWGLLVRRIAKYRLRRRHSLIGGKRPVPLGLGDRIVPRLVLLGRQFAAAAAKPVRLLLLFLLLVLLGKLATHLAARLRVPAVHRRLRADPTRKTRAVNA
jgi:hypothetical protein